MSETRSFHPATWYLYCFLSEFVVIYPVYLIMMEASGIDPVGIASLLMIWSLATLLFELPTGVLADLLPRKPVLLIAGVLDAVAFLCWFFWPSFWGFAAGFIIWSFAGALASGTAEAYLYEVWDQPEQFGRIYGRTEAVESAGVAAALLLGGYLASYGFDLVLLLSVGGPLAAVLMLWLALPDAPQGDRTNKVDLKNFSQTLFSGFRFTFTHGQILTIVLVSAVLAALAGVYEEYIGVLFNEMEFELSLIGIIYAGIWLARAVGAYFAEHLASLNLSLALFTFASGALVLAVDALPLEIDFGNSATVFLLVALLAFFAASAAQEVVFGAGLQQRLKDDTRATITSIQTLGTEAAAAIIFLTVGWLAADASWRAALTELTWAAMLVSFISLGVGLYSLRNFTHINDET